MIKIQVKKIFKQKNVCQQFEFHDIKLLSKQQITIQRKKYCTKDKYKKKVNSDGLFFFHRILVVSTVFFS